MTTTQSKNNTDKLIVDGRVINRLLISKLRYHGDVLLTMPIVKYLKGRFPTLEIDLLVYDDSAKLVAHQQSITAIHCIGRQWKNLDSWQQARREVSLIKRLANRQFDGFIHLTEDWRGALLRKILRIPVSITGQYRRREHSFWWKRCFSHYYRVAPSNRHIVDRQADALRTLGLEPSPEELILELQPNQRDAIVIEQRLNDALLNNQNFVHIHPGSRFSHKVWPEKNIAELCDRFAQIGYPVVLTSAPDENERLFIEQVIEASKRPVIHWGGQLSLTELTELTRRASLFIGVDSAPAHIAAAVKTPSVVLFGPTSSETWKPWHEDSTVVTAEFDCQPCSKKGCNNSGVSDCLNALTTDTVWQVVKQKIDLSEFHQRCAGAQIA